jgi:hypothetical protein
VLLACVVGCFRRIDLKQLRTPQDVSYLKIRVDRKQAARWPCSTDSESAVLVCIRKQNLWSLVALIAPFL